MKNKFVLGALLALSLSANATDNPVIMTINGKDVKLSEFEYMYHKNNNQQIEKESLEDYVDRFVVYKLKVAEAEAAGLDTVKTFVTEFNGHKAELMKPYLSSEKYIEPFAKETYERMKKKLYVSHIMLPPYPGNDLKLDSIRNRVLSGEDFGELAKKYSSDDYSSAKGGDLGMIWVGRFPYEFEDAAYKTSVGNISDVVKSDFGYHLIKVTGENFLTGKYRVAHIVKTYKRAGNAVDPEDVVKVKASMDSLYNLLKNGADFAQLAKDFSDDKRSANNGGELGWFGTGQLVKAIEDKMITTQVGGVSEPSVADYGVHLVKVLEYKPLGSYEEVKEDVLAIVNRDDRSKMISNLRLNDLKKELNYKPIAAFDAEIERMLSINGFDSSFVANVKKCDIPVFTFKGGEVPSSHVAKNWTSKMKLGVEQGRNYIKKCVEKLVNETLLEFEKEDLVNKYPEYANLLNEYKEGILLFEISNKKVWAKSSEDKEGLENFFKKNKAKYTVWEQPRFKGLILYSLNDSIENEVKNFMTKLGGDTIATALHKKFRRNIKIERHLTAKGENRFVDELVFNGEKATPDKKFTKYFILEGKVINQPEEAADVRGQVTTDYQNALEKEWVKELKSKYKVKINKKVLKLVKE